MNDINSNIKQLKDISIADAVWDEDGVLIFFENRIAALMKYEITSQKATLLARIESKKMPCIFRIIKYRDILFLFDKTTSRVYQYYENNITCIEYEQEMMFSDFFRVDNCVYMLPFAIEMQGCVFDMEQKTFKKISFEWEDVCDISAGQEIVYPFLRNSLFYLPVLGGNYIYLFDYQKNTIRKQLINSHNTQICSCGYDENREGIILSNIKSKEVIYIDDKIMSSVNKWEGETCQSRYFSRWFVEGDFFIGLPGKSSSEIYIINNKTMEKEVIDLAGFISETQVKRDISKIINLVKLDNNRLILLPHNMDYIIILYLDSLHIDFLKIFMDGRELWKSNAEESVNYSLKDFLQYICYIE